MADPIVFREIKLEGGWLMVKPEKQDIGKAMAIVRKHKNRLYDLEVKEHREKRSLDANAHYISRAQGGLGIPENGLTLCPICHRTYDQTTARKEMRAFFREYLQECYPEWDESKLIYRKEY